MTQQREVIVGNWLEAPHVATVFVERTAYRAESTVSRYQETLRAFINFCCTRWNCHPEELNFRQCTQLEIRVGDRDVTITDQIRREVINEFLETASSPTRQKTAQRVLWVYFQYMVDIGELRFNPVPKVESQSAPKRQVRLGIDEIGRLVQEVLAAKEPYRTASLVQLSAGLRFGELRSLRMTDVKCINGEWEITINREALKGRRESKLPLPDISNLMEHWMKWRADHRISSEFLFVGPRGGRLGHNEFNGWWKEIASRAGIRKNVTTHDMRRAYATVMDAYVENPDVLALAMRHVPDAVTRSHVVTRSYVTTADLVRVRSWLDKLPVRHLADALAALWLHRVRDDATDDE